MSDLPDPLTPPDCDLSDFQYMELDVRRLRDSKFAASADGEAFRAGILLWCAAWHQIPAGSLPDDDIELANLAGYGRVVKEWKKVRSGALHNFIKCSDGRLYHPILAEKAIAAFEAKLRHAYGKLLERLRKENKKRAEEKVALVGVPTFEQWKSGEYPNGILPESKQVSAGIPPEGKSNSAGIPPENPLKGNREGTEQNGEGYLNTSVPIGTGADAPPVDPLALAKKEIWASGKALFASRGIDEKSAGGILGQLLGKYSAEIVLDAVRAGVKAQTPDPTSYLTACCQRAVGERAKVQKNSRHNGFDETDYSEGVTEDGRIA